MVSTAKDILGPDNVQPPDHDLGMALYLDEWMTHKNVRNADLARALKCSRSLIGKWRGKERPLRDIDWIKGICEFLQITQEQLSQKPSKSDGKVIVSKGLESHSEHTANKAVSSEGAEMIGKRADLHHAFEQLPDELVDTAISLMNRLMGQGGTKSPDPTKRGSTKG